MAIEKISFQKNPNIGLYGFSTDKLCFLGGSVKEKVIKTIEKSLGVPVIKASMLGTPLVGIFAAGNSKGVIVSDTVFEKEIDSVQKHTDVLVVETNFTALGNLILCNDHGCIISGEIEDHRNDIKKFLGVPVRVGTIAGMDLVGSLAVATNKGCLAYKMIETKEAGMIGKTLNVNVDVGSVNFGNYWVKSGIIANSSGLLAGEQTSGPELGICSETFGFL
ncbi:MAG: translation initiation factor IF-6 [Candidatus Aenigmarchaeota archaeon]|nr:translation initiation factor IF-6 [Candidatus Aenigmarchaeota archaeon]